MKPIKFGRSVPTLEYINELNRQIHVHTFDRNSERKVPQYSQVQFRSLPQAKTRKINLIKQARQKKQKPFPVDQFLKSKSINMHPPQQQKQIVQSVSVTIDTFRNS